MIQNPYRSIFVFLAFLVLGLSNAWAFSIPVSQAKLKNGLQLIVVEDHRSPIVFHAITYKVGAADHEAGKSGLAHFFEHLLFKATKNRPLGTFDRLMDENGAQKNAFTTQDITMFWERGGEDMLPLLMDIEADRMKNLILTDEVVATELKVVQEERRQQTESDPSALLGEKIDAALFSPHPYGKPVIGLPEDVAKFNRADAEAFYRKHYEPANAIVLVVGDVDPVAVEAMAEKYYGPLVNDVERTASQRPPVPQGTTHRSAELADPRVTTPAWMRKYAVPSFGGSSARQAAAIDLMGVILGGTSQSRLSQTLVFGDKSATSAGAGYNGDQRDSGTFVFYAVPSNGNTLDKTAEAVDRVISDFKANGPSQAELDEARQQAIAEYIYALDQPTSFGRMFGLGVANGVPLERLLNRDKGYLEVTTDDVKRAANDILRMENSVTGKLLPAMTAQ